LAFGATFSQYPRRNYCSFFYLSLPRALTRLFLSAFAQNHACLPQAGLRAKTHFGVQARLRASGMALGVDARPPQ